MANLEAEGPIAEFITLDGVFWNGTCGQCALEVSKAAIKGLKSSQVDMVAIAHDMQAHGEAGPTGASTMGGLRDEAIRQGLTVLHVTTYDQPLSENWHQELMDNAGINPIILEFADAGVLVDQVTRAHDETGVRYHYIVILNKQALGYVVNDGDSPEAATKFPVYSYANLAQAIPCAIMILKGPIMSTVPTGWKDSAEGNLNETAGVLTAPNGNTVEHGFRFWVLTHTWEAANEPTTEEFALDGHTGQDFKNCRLFWNGTTTVQEALPAPSPVPAPPAPKPAPVPASAPVPTDPALVSALEAIQAAVTVALSKVVK